MAGEFPFHTEAEKWTCDNDIPAGSGLYAIFLPSVENLPDGWKGYLSREDRLFYIGKGEPLTDRLEKHFTANDSTKDTFRRSVGAVLRFNPDLKVTQHSSDLRLTLRGPKKTQFSFENEEVLSDWIQQNCFFTFLRLNSRIEVMEIDLIEEFKPPLNLLHNPGKLTTLLKGVRAKCAECAEAARR
jgi:hypothetical protein